MPFCIICNRYYGSEKARRRHAKCSKIINEKSKMVVIKNMEKTIEPSHIIGLEPGIETHIPIHEEPQEKKKINLACKTLRNLHR